ncbi:MAG: FlgD immunoglobulin-like domain containing protein [Candidatus Latescibacterota bacterium]
MAFSLHSRQAILVDGLAPTCRRSFDPATTIRYEVPESSPVRLVIRDTSGRAVRAFGDDLMGPGSFSVVWDGKDGEGRKAGNGVYFYQMEAGAFTQTRKMVLVK